MLCTISRALLVFVAFFLSGLTASWANENDDFFNKIKVAFTYRIIQFVNLTEANSKPLSLCILSSGNIIQLFKDYEPKRINNQDIQLLFLAQPPKSSDQCSVLYIDNAEKTVCPKSSRK